MLKRTVMQAKDSLIITLPKHLCEALGIAKGDILNVELKGNKLIFAPVSPSKTTGAANAGAMI